MSNVGVSNDNSKNSNNNDTDIEPLVKKASKLDITQLDETILKKRARVKLELFRQSVMEYYYGIIQKKPVYQENKMVIKDIRCTMETESHFKDLIFMIRLIEKTENRTMSLLEKLEWLESYNTMAIMELKKEIVLLFKIRNELIKFSNFDKMDENIKKKLMKPTNGDEYFDKLCYEMQYMIDKYFADMNVYCKCSNAFCDKRMASLPVEFHIFHD